MGTDVGKLVKVFRTKGVSTQELTVKERASIVWITHQHIIPLQIILFIFCNVYNISSHLSAFFPIPKFKGISMPYLSPTILLSSEHQSAVTNVKLQQRKNKEALKTV